MLVLWFRHWNMLPGTPEPWAELASLPRALKLKPCILHGTKRKSSEVVMLLSGRVVHHTSLENFSMKCHEHWGSNYIVEKWQMPMFRVYHISTIYIHGSKHVITYYEVQGSKACHSFTTNYRCPRMSLICQKIHVSILSCKYWGNVTEGKVLQYVGSLKLNCIHISYTSRLGTR